MLDKHKQFIVPSEEQIDRMSELMKMFIMPNEISNEQQRAAFEKAVMYQIQHESTIAESVGDDALPQGITHFSIGHFSATLDNAYEPYINRKTICPYAYSVLLRAGLLYRGMERGDDIQCL